jgi:hypothetical protein
VKPAYVQVELGAILDGGLFDEFVVLWLLVQASRFQGDGEGHCRLDAWLELGQQSGERALNRLRDGVQSALEELSEEGCPFRSSRCTARATACRACATWRFAVVPTSTSTATCGRCRC